VIVVHLYQNYIPSCSKLNSIFEELAKQYPLTKFARIKSTDARPGFDDAGLPALLIYKNRNTIGSFVKVTDDLPESFDIEDVEEFLTGHNALVPSQGLPIY